ncbi:MAG: efflux transporter outer membrane subunit [Pseudomonadota bacterium]|nr:efflux transporter outer membrane subunit [Pseudomonadota bacterium]
MKYVKNGGIALAAIAALLTSSCAVGPDFLRPILPDSAGYSDKPIEKTAAAEGTAGAAQSFASDKDIPADWWKMYGSEPLNGLIGQALKANPDLQAAEAALRQAQENVKAGYGSLFPSVDISGGPTREKFNPAAFGNSGARSSIFTLYNASVSVSYALDIFGGARREIESLQALADLQRFQKEAAYVSLTANVVTAALREASLRAQIKETQDIVGIEQNQLDILQKQFDVGAISKLIVLQQEANLAQFETSLAPLQKQLAQAHDQLAALTGNFPNAALAEDFDLATLRLPEEIPLSLPSKLVEQRPDIRIAEEALHSASAEIGVATAEMLPQISINGSYGAESVRFHKLFTPQSNVWDIGANLLQPIFHGGQLFHERQAAVAAYDRAEAQYRSTVLAAFQNVADSLRALQYDAEEVAAQVHAEHAASESFHLAQAQYKVGAINYLSMLDAERSYQQARIGLVQAQAARLADTAALFQALGGGWWNRDLPKPDPIAAPAITPATDASPAAMPETSPAPPTEPPPTAVPSPDNTPAPAQPSLQPLIPQQEKIPNV